MHGKIHGGTFSDFGVYFHFVRVFFDIGKPHASAEAQVSHIVGRGGVALLHRLFHVGYAGTMVYELCVDAVGVNFNVNLSAARVDEGVHLREVDVPGFHDAEVRADVEAPDVTSDSLGTGLEAILARRSA